MHWYIKRVTQTDIWSKSKILELEQILQLHFDPSQNIITYLKAWRFSLDLMWKANAFQTLGPFMNRLLEPKETWLDFVKWNFI